MANLWRRLKNLWQISSYRIDESRNGPKKAIDLVGVNLVKDFSTVKSKLATIIPEDQEDFFNNGETS